jgi:uncharacterized Rmd1/YagE family protein
MRGVEAIAQEAERDAMEVLAMREKLIEAMRARAEEAQRIRAAIEGRGYNVLVGYVQNEKRHEAFAFSYGRTTGFGWGEDEVEALRALAGDLGIPLEG